MGDRSGSVIRASLSKNYIEQTHFLRSLATTFGSPSHMVRRRTLVEAVYDIIATRMISRPTLQRKTVDWHLPVPANQILSVFSIPNKVCACVT